MNTSTALAGCEWNGTLFPACCSDALYCSDACAQQAHQRRQAAKALPAASGLDVREWNGTPISRRTDGYVNATAMCKANGKHLPHYRANERTSQYLAALAGSVGIPTDRLVVSITTGPNHQRGTWVHPRLAIDLARWISPAFAVWMDGWFLEWIQGGQMPASPVRTTNHQPTPAPRIVIHAASEEQAARLWEQAVSRTVMDGLMHHRRRTRQIGWSTRYEVATI